RLVRETLREQVAVAGFVTRQPQPADDTVTLRGKARLGAHAAVTVQHLERDAVLAQHRDVAADAVELRLGAKELQRAEAALVIGDAGLLAQRTQTVAAVFGNADHPRFVEGVA